MVVTRVLEMPLRRYKMKRFIIVFFIVFTLNTLGLVYACTIVMAARGDQVLVGNNEDGKFPFTSVWFIPASDGKYGRVYFGMRFGKTNIGICGGMNDRGLFIDGSSVPGSETGWEPADGKERFRGNVEGYVLAHCATVDDVVALVNRYNLGILSRGKFLVADKNGNSVVVECSRGAVRFLKRRGWYQISTNFVQSNYSPGGYLCHRFNLAEDIFKASDTCSVDLIRNILSATRMDGHLLSGVTLYSYICDLKNGDIFIYNFHDFEHVVKMNLHLELKKGEKAHDIVSLFPYTTYAERFYKENMTKPSKDILLKIVTEQGVDKAIRRFHEMKKEFATATLYKYDFGEGQINSLGYALMQMNRMNDAIEIFKLNVAEHPESWNVYDSLGEAHMARGDKELAIEHFTKSLELNPKNDNGAKMLKQLKEKR